MGYFGGGGVSGDIHPSLKAYIDCFSSPPFPKRFPRLGGVWDQDPILMRDFRAIREYEVQWKETQEQLNNMKGKTDSQEIEQGGGNDLEDALNQYIEDLEEEGTF